MDSYFRVLDEFATGALIFYYSQNKKKVFASNIYLQMIENKHSVYDV